MDETNMFLERERLLKKGVLNKKDISTFMDCGYTKAKKVYETIEQEVHKEGKTVGVFGIQTKRLLKYIGITEKDVFKAAELERQKENIKKDV